MNEHLQTLEPTIVWRHFQTLCETPRPSGGEEPLIGKITAWAEARGLTCERDEAGNLLVRKAASPGFEQAPGVILQSHLDMVTQANADTPHDFTRDPIETWVDDDGWLRARGTTLGADNGLGAAAALAILEDDSLTHGPLEALFTVEEEASLVGATHLAPNWLQGRYLLNLDSEERGQVYIGCAGGADVQVDTLFPTEKLTSLERGYRISVTGLVGGHSGLDIATGRGNANRIMFRLLHLLDDLDVRLSDYHGGTMRNAITREAYATVVVPFDGEEAFKSRVEQLQRVLRDELAGVDEGVTLSIAPATAEEALTLAASRGLVATMLAAPYGIERMSVALPGVVETSNNLGVVGLEEGRFHLGAMVRSLRDSAALALCDRIVALFSLLGIEASVDGVYPGWVPAPQSPLLKRFIAVHEQTVGVAPEVKVIHAGLECGIIGAKYPELDMVSFGPTILGAHSPTERVEIDSVSEFYTVLKATVEHLAQD
ncbi:beta-Ala-His dipeptidase [Phytohalomonas tamaricis]|uniref:beta-Ala-His dipeptidase n=1 Tax=Phytohalomonas tamaricis TaxID=2081032 RepID=UPI000D0B0E03|nr:beta-Ala-His dipeptidase [Phytohalomonas tamaricis]